MLSSNLVTAIYIAASVLFILSLGGLSNQEKAKRAVWYGIIGMALAVGGTIFGPGVTLAGWLIPALVIGARSVSTPKQSRSSTGVRDQNSAGRRRRTPNPSRIRPGQSMI